MKIMAICASCRNEFEEDPEQRVLCPKCGATSRVISMSVTALASSRTSTPSLEIISSSATPLSFGAIITSEYNVPDGIVIKLIEPAYRQIVMQIKDDPHFAANITPRQWEEIIAAAYDKAGFDEVILTPRSGDLGRDVIAIKRGFGSVRFIEQVKAYKPEHLVKADEVRSLLGVLSADLNATKAIFTTTSYFAPRLTEDDLIRKFLPFRLELVDKNGLLDRLVANL